MNKKFVIDKTTKQVKRFGFCDFLNDDVFDGLTEEIIENESILDPPIDETVWYWNGETSQFQTTAP